MKVILTNLARKSIKNIYYYNAQYSLEKAKRIDKNIRYQIHNLQDFPYIGRYVPELNDSRFREIIYDKYRIIYCVNEVSSTIYITFAFSSRQSFHILYNLYKKDISKYKLLTREEELELGKQIKNGNSFIKGLNK